MANFKRYSEKNELPENGDYTTVILDPYSDGEGLIFSKYENGRVADTYEAYSPDIPDDSNFPNGWTDKKSNVFIQDEVPGDVESRIYLNQIFNQCFQNYDVYSKKLEEIEQTKDECLDSDENYDYN